MNQDTLCVKCAESETSPERLLSSLGLNRKISTTFLDKSILQLQSGQSGITEGSTSPSKKRINRTLFQNAFHECMMLKDYDSGLKSLLQEVRASCRAEKVVLLTHDPISDQFIPLEKPHKMPELTVELSSNKMLQSVFKFRDVVNVSDALRDKRFDTIWNTICSTLVSSMMLCPIFNPLSSITIGHILILANKRAEGTKASFQPIIPFNQEDVASPLQPRRRGSLLHLLTHNRQLSLPLETPKPSQSRKEPKTAMFCINGVATNLQRPGYFHIISGETRHKFDPIRSINIFAV